MSQNFQDIIDRLKFISPNNPTSVKLNAVIACFQEEDRRKLIEDVPEDYKSVDNVIQETTSNSPNLIIYLIIRIGMARGGWWELTERQRQVIRAYIFNKNSLEAFARQQGVTYYSVRESYLRGIEILRRNAIQLLPSLEDIFLPQDTRGKSKGTKEYRDANRERIAKVRKTEAYANRRIVAGPGRGHHKTP